MEGSVSGSGVSALATEDFYRCQTDGLDFYRNMHPEQQHARPSEGSKRRGGGGRSARLMEFGCSLPSVTGGLPKLQIDVLCTAEKPSETYAV